MYIYVYNPLECLQGRISVSYQTWHGNGSEAARGGNTRKNTLLQTELSRPWSANCCSSDRTIIKQSRGEGRRKGEDRSKGQNVFPCILNMLRRNAGKSKTTRYPLGQVPIKPLPRNFREVTREGTPAWSADFFARTSLYYKLFTLLDLCVSSLRRGHANLLCIVPSLTDDPPRESKGAQTLLVCVRVSATTILILLVIYTYIYIYIHTPIYLYYVCVHIYIYIYIYMYVCMYVCMYIYIYIYIYIGLF